MGNMNKQLKLPQIQKIMMEFEKQVRLTTIFNPFLPEGNTEFSKSLTMNWETTCDIPFKRYFLGFAINHTNRDGGGHILE